MSNVLNSLESLFSLSAAPVVGVRENYPVYFNPAAAKFFSGKISGNSAEKLFPQWPYAYGSVISTTILEHNCKITVTEIEDVLVLTLSEPINEEVVSAIPINALATMASSITTLRIAADQMADFCATDKQQEPYISIFYQNYYRLLRVTEHLTAISGLFSGTLPFNPRPIELSTFFSDIVSAVRYLTADLNITLDYFPPANFVTVNADAKLIEQLILTLIANSIKSTPDGGTISLRVSENMGNVVISLQDNGCGISPNALSSIFNLNNPIGKHEVPSEDGGIGLPLASVIAAKHGGTIVLDSREGEGTSIRVMFKSSDTPVSTLRSPAYVYGNLIPVRALTELSEVLSRLQYNRDNILGN